MSFLERIAGVFTKMSNTQVLIGAIAFVLAFTLLFYFSFKFLRKNGAKIVIYGYLALYLIFGTIFVLIDISVLSICGENDGVLNKEKYEENKKNLPSDTQEFIIEGGNHAGFGMYGHQIGDGDANITNEAQILKTAEQIFSFINK